MSWSRTWLWCGCGNCRPSCWFSWCSIQYAEPQKAWDHSYSECGSCSPKCLYWRMLEKNRNVVLWKIKYFSILLAPTNFTVGIHLSEYWNVWWHRGSDNEPLSSLWEVYRWRTQPEGWCCSCTLVRMKEWKKNAEMLLKALPIVHIIISFYQLYLNNNCHYCIIVVLGGLVLLALLLLTWCTRRGFLLSRHWQRSGRPD